MSLPGVFAGSALVFIPALGMFAIPDLLGGTSGTMIGNVIKQQFLDSRDWPFGSVLSIVLTLAAVLMAAAAKRRLISRRPSGIFGAKKEIGGLNILLSIIVNPYIKYIYGQVVH